MRSLTRQEITSIQAGNYSDWSVVAIAGFSSGLAFGIFEAFETLSLTAGLKFFVACSVPTAIASTIIVSTIAFLQQVEQ